MISQQIMTFEAFPADAVLQFNDPGPFYVRESGRLRSPPGLGLIRAGPHQGILQLHQPAFSLENTTVDNSTTRTPRKLFDISLDFVAANITLVDSLAGFPEVVGRQLFDAAHLLHKLCPRALELFCEAYGNSILHSVNLTGHRLAVDELLNCNALFLRLSELDVGGCNIGEDSEILPIVANLICLRRLGLASNDLTDAGIRRLTTPLRVMDRGPRRLLSLDLAGNESISDKSAGQYLTVFTSLTSLDLSGCNISSEGINKLKKKLKLENRVISTMATTKSFLQPVKNFGWALPLVEQWKESSTNCMQRGKSKASFGSAKAASFYGRTQERLANILKSTKPIKKVHDMPIIQLVASSSSNQDNHQADLVTKENMKRSKVERSKVARQQSTQGRRCQEAGQVNARNDELSTLDKELTMQYSCPDMKHSTRQDRKWLGLRTLELETEDTKENQMEQISEQLVKQAKPPPRKKIKLCSQVSSQGFFDILNGGGK
ncbi:leucine-rich repeat-containing protein 42-like [Asterias amurensis]|uniref:leucine-rich repeat-containing protein 42-like n=1 Tax=Asterias amurensis TaxID=7602 RepID=UPI003AB3F71C